MRCPTPQLLRPVAIPRERSTTRKSVWLLSVRRVRRMLSSGSSIPSSRVVFVAGHAERTAALVSAVWMVRVTVAGAADGVSDGGLKLAVAPGGKPLTEKVMSSPNVPCGETAKLNAALWPGRMVADGVELAVNAKSTTDCVSAAAALLEKLPLPLYTASTTLSPSGSALVE